jgi:hypothetical protein
MPKYEAWMPIHALARWELETEEEITDPQELRDQMVEDGQAVGQAVRDWCFQINDPHELDSKAVDEGLFVVEPAGED